MKRIFQLLTMLLAVGLADTAAQDNDGKNNKSEKRDEKREKSDRSERPGERREKSDRSERPDERREKSDRSEMRETPGITAKPQKSEDSPTPREPMTKSAGYEAFLNVRTKNIFDPSRRGPRIETPPTASSSTPSSRGRALALTGTMVTEGKALAFFGGSAADGNRVISVGNSVANCKVTAIAATQVSLEHEGKSLVLEVGRQISFGATPGDPVAVGSSVEAVAPPPAEGAGLPTMPVLPASAGDKSEILRRMMERRAKEGGQ